MSGSDLYQNDFYLWTQQQAALLRALPASSTPLDTANLAEEMEEMGKAQVRDLTHMLARTLSQVVRLAIEPDSDAGETWAGSADEMQSSAIAMVSPALKEAVSLDEIWSIAKFLPLNALTHARERNITLPDQSPMTLDQLLADDFDPMQAAEEVMESLSSKTNRL